MLLWKMRQPHPPDGSSRLLVATAFQTGLIRCRQPSPREFDLPVGKLTPVFDDRHVAAGRYSKVDRSEANPADRVQTLTAATRSMPCRYQIGAPR
jgi:hypothetical protein